MWKKTPNPNNFNPALLWVFWQTKMGGFVEGDHLELALGVLSGVPGSGLGLGLGWD